MWNYLKAFATLTEMSFDAKFFFYVVKNNYFLAARFFPFFFFLAL